MQREASPGDSRSRPGRGFARDVQAGTGGPGPLPPAVAERFAAQVACVAHHVDGAARRFARFRATRVAVLGTDEVARWCALCLVRNGAGTVASDVDDPGGTPRWPRWPRPAARSS